MKKMFIIFSHPGNTNRNGTEMPTHSSQNGCHQENQQQIPKRMQGKKNPYTLMVGMYISAATKKLLP
jgi:hypothetical protein